MTAAIALFRGINVGGNKIVPMKDLKALHESLGCQSVSTYIQSGNVVFIYDSVDASDLSIKIEQAFAERFGFRSDVIVRTLAQWDEMIANNPFQHQPEKEPKWSIITILRDRPTAEAIQDFQQSYQGPEEIYVLGSEMHVFYPEGMGRSKLTMPLIEKRLKTTGTARNWNTVMRLRDLLAALQ
jgi:uncharacterized protein (DUF1697 family)